MFYNTKEFRIDTGNIQSNCIRFGTGSKSLVLISGLNIRDAKGKAAALGVAYAYKCFAKDYTVYVFDRKENLPEHYTIEEIAEDIASCINYLGIGSSDVLGVSQGGMIAQYLAINHPELVFKLVLGVTCSRTNDTIRQNINRWCDMARHGDMKGVMKDYFYQTYSEQHLKKNAALIPVLMKTMKTMEKIRFLTLADACLTCNTYDLLQKIVCPVLVLGGKKDKVVTPEASAEIAEKLGCEIYMYDEYGHSAYEEAQDFNERVIKFFK